ncbi:MAG: leucine--tRNA ligase [Holosporales bacterium]
MSASSTTSERRYAVRAAENKWRARWEEAGLYTTTKDAKKPYYILEMFPYPSGNIHIGHVRNYGIGDTLARFKRAQGFDVLHPMGWDAFGLPAENAAIKNKVHPAAWTEQNIASMRAQLQSIGFSYDWSREIATCRPDYYQHEQAMFLDFLEKGLAYRKEASVNWDPVENTVLANEQVIDGRGWRSGALVERRKLSQWFLKITHYADELLTGLDTLTGWPEKVRTMQARWLGKSMGATVRFALSHSAETLDVYTTRPDTLFGASFLAIAADHPLAQQAAQHDPAIAGFCAECQQTGTSEAVLETMEKKGIKTPYSVQHPFYAAVTLPVYIANFVLMDYGSGALFGCPAHDQRDLDFARAYGLPVTPVVLPSGADPATFAIQDTAYTDDGTLYNSGFLNGLSVTEAKKAAIAQLEEQHSGTGKTTWRIRDWGVSRQRYWGCPIPVIHCDSCGVVPVPRAELPVTLPADVDFSQPGNPLARHPNWADVPCPTCGKPAKRETDTFDTFFESSWYFGRFLAPNDDKKPFTKEQAAEWLPVKHYIGGVEHAVLHLLYARFFTKALRDCGYWNLNEPFERLLTQGMVCHATYKSAAGEWLFPSETTRQDKQTVEIKTGAPVMVGRSEKMSKSLKNVVDPAYILDTYGADTARLFMLSDSPPERDIEWTEEGIDGAWRYVNRVWRLVMNAIPDLAPLGTPPTADALAQHEALYRLAHETIAGVTEDFEAAALNRAIARLRTYSNALEDAGAALDPSLRRWCLETYTRLIAPLMPHLAEELWEALGHQGFIEAAGWPAFDTARLVKTRATLAVQVNGKLRGTLEVELTTPKEELESAALALPNVVKALEGRSPKKIIIIPGKIINVVG